MAALSEPERVVLLVWSYPAAVNDGGHVSFFYNSYGEHASETVAALRQCGAPEYADLLAEAVALFPDGVPRDIDARNGALDALPPEAESVFSRLDDDFYRLGDDALMERLIRFWNKNTH